jgi:hypothetical protein
MRPSVARREDQRQFFSTAEIASFGWMFMPASAETSGMLAIRRTWFVPTFRSLPSRAGNSLEELRAIRDGSGLAGVPLLAGESNSGPRRAVRGMVDRTGPPN